MKTIEIITHCWAGPNNQYAKLLAWQLWSFCQHAPECASITVCWSVDDAVTRYVIDSFRLRSVHPKALVAGQPVSTVQLLNRPIWRHRLAQRTTADIVWFVDCDYLIGKDFLQTLSEKPLPEGKLFFPTQTLISRDHATGDRYIEKISNGSGIQDLNIDPADFIPKIERKAIGGIQIVPGDVARAEGYVPHIRRYQQPAPEGTDTIIGFGADAAYRRQLGTRGTPIDLPNLFRIRHSKTGDGRAERAGITSRER